MEQQQIDISYIIGLTLKLITILKKETKALSQMNIQDFARIYNDKVILINELEHIQRLFKQSTELITGLSAKKKQRLIEVDKLLDEAKQENFEALERAINVNQHIINIVKDVVMGNIYQKIGYNNMAKYGTKRQIEKHMPPLSINDCV